MIGWKCVSMNTSKMGRMPLTGLKVSVVSTAFSDDVRSAATEARTAGFSGLLVDAVSAALDLTELSASGRREFQRLLSSNGLALVGLRGDVGANGFGPGADVDRLLSRLGGMLETAAGLQARLLCLEAGPLPEPPRVAPVKPAVTPDQAGLILLPTAPAAPMPEEPARPRDAVAESHVDSALIALGQLADRFGCTVAFRSELASFVALERAMNAAACPWFAVDLDPVAILRDEWPIDEVFSRLGRSIRHVRGRDALKGAGRRTKPAAVGAGSTEWPALLSRLDQSGYNGWISVDPTDLSDRRAAARAALSVINRSGASS